MFYLLACFCSFRVEYDVCLFSYTVCLTSFFDILAL